MPLQKGSKITEITKNDLIEYKNPKCIHIL